MMSFMNVSGDHGENKPPVMLNTRISAMVTAHKAFGKSLGFFISAMKLGRVIWPMKV